MDNQLKRNPFRKENPFKSFTAKAQEEKAWKDYLDSLNAAVRMDPENKHGAW